MIWTINLVTPKKVDYLYLAFFILFLINYQN